MNPGDKVLVEAEVTQIGDGFIVVRFPKVGPQPAGHARVPMDQVKKRK